jgi:phosphoribosylanthranilate isomerase
MCIRVKICCIWSIAEAGLAISYGASALGLVSKMPSGPGLIPDDLIKAIAQSTPPPHCHIPADERNFGSRQIVQQSKVPVFLAGGLTADNVQQAVEEVQPFGLDLCSGVRTNNRLNPEKLEHFFNRIR